MPLKSSMMIIQEHVTHGNHGRCKWDGGDCNRRHFSSKLPDKSAGRLPRTLGNTPLPRQKRDSRPGIVPPFFVSTFNQKRCDSTSTCVLQREETTRPERWSMATSLRDKAISAPELSVLLFQDFSNYGEQDCRQEQNYQKLNTHVAFLLFQKRESHLLNTSLMASPCALTDPSSQDSDSCN